MRLQELSRVIMLDLHEWRPSEKPVNLSDIVGMTAVSAWQVSAKNQLQGVGISDLRGITRRPSYLIETAFPTSQNIDRWLNV